MYESQSDQETSLTRLEQSLKRLKIAIENWRRDYLLLATEDGTITFFGKRSASNVYQQNQEILYIIPPQNGDAYIGNLRVPLDQSGRIEEGQSVYLKFDEFPFKKFGYIEGKVKRKVNFEKDEYLIQVDLDTAMITNYGNKLPFNYYMTGTGEVLVGDKRFISRLLE